VTFTRCGNRLADNRAGIAGGKAVPWLVKTADVADPQHAAVPTP
jgi:hypothetical protein